MSTRKAYNPPQRVIAHHPVHRDHGVPCLPRASVSILSDTCEVLKLGRDELQKRRIMLHGRQPRSKYLHLNHMHIMYNKKGGTNHISRYQTGGTGAPHADLGHSPLTQGTCPLFLIHGTYPLRISIRRVRPKSTW